jgi:hypothetical protein
MENPVKMDDLGVYKPNLGNTNITIISNEDGINLMFQAIHLKDQD